MTNEELCQLIRKGDTGYLPELWEQTRRFITVQAKQYYYRCESHNGTEIEDLIQSGYFAVLEAVKYFEAERGFTYLTYLGVTLKNAFREAMGIRSSKRDMLNYSCSLDEPVGEDESTPLLDLIGDLTPENGDVEAEVIESVYHQELHEALECAMEILPDKKRSILQTHYYFGLSFEELAAERGVSRSLIENQAYEARMRIYNSSHRGKLASFLYADNDNNLSATGYLAWKHSGISAVERAALERGTKR